MLNTANSGFVAYDLPGSANARILWGTGRGGQKRNGTAPEIPPLGDMSGNRHIGLEDIILSLRVSSGIIPDSAVQIAAEVNADGKVGIVEAVYGLQKVSESR